MSTVTEPGHASKNGVMIPWMGTVDDLFIAQVVHLLESRCKSHRAAGIEMVAYPTMRFGCGGLRSELEKLRGLPKQLQWTIMQLLFKRKIQLEQVAGSAQPALPALTLTYLYSYLLGVTLICALPPNLASSSAERLQEYH